MTNSNCHAPHCVCFPFPSCLHVSHTRRQEKKAWAGVVGATTQPALESSPTRTPDRTTSVDRAWPISQKRAGIAPELGLPAKVGMPATASFWMNEWLGPARADVRRSPRASVSVLQAILPTTSRCPSPGVEGISLFDNSVIGKIGFGWSFAEVASVVEAPGLGSSLSRQPLPATRSTRTPAAPACRPLARHQCIVNDSKKMGAAHLHLCGGPKKESAAAGCLEDKQPLASQLSDSKSAVCAMLKKRLRVCEGKAREWAGGARGLDEWQTGSL